MIEAQLAFNVAMKKSLPWVGHYGISTCSKTLDVIPDAKAIRSDRQAEGLGGTRSITHQGISPLFGIEMAYIMVATLQICYLWVPHCRPTTMVR
jgi:hypothetical protein